MKRLCLLLLGSLTGLLAAAILPAAASATITEYPVPTPASLPYGITAGPDGALWFAEENANKIGRVTTAGSITEFALPPGTDPVGIAAGPDGALWFTEFSADKIGRITTAGSFSQFPIPTPGSFPFGITAGPDGALWFTEGTGNNIGRITTAGSFSEFAIPTPASNPLGIAAGADGALWFAEENSNKIGRVTTAGSFSEFAVPTPTSFDTGITAGPDGALWFTEENANKIGRVTTAGSFSEFAVPTPSSAPFGITAGPDGAVWFTELGGGKVGRVTTGGSFSEFPIPTPSSAPLAIAAGPDGAVWFTEFGGNKVGRVTPGPGAPASLALAPKTSTNPVDTQHCVTATVKDSSGDATPDIAVRFSVSGSVSTSGSQTTDSNGQATFCYQGPPLPGADAISAYADTNTNNTQDSGEPGDTATKSWVLPSGTALCVVKVTNGGWIVTDDGDQASFGGSAKESSALVASGNEEYQDHGPAEPLSVHSLSVDAITCNANRTQASVFGQATINGTGAHNFRIDVQDNAEPGRGKDHYRMRLDTGYDSGDHILRGGNVQIH